MDEIEVAAAVIVKDGKYLITQRYPDAHYGLYWEFPGGKRKEHESLEDCLVREIKEELDIEIEIGELIHVEDYTYPDRKVKLYFYGVKIFKGVPRALDCQNLKWIQIEAMKKYNFPPADKNLLKILISTRSWS